MEYLLEYRGTSIPRNVEHPKSQRLQGADGSRSGVRASQAKRSEAFAGGNSSRLPLSSSSSTTASKRPTAQKAARRTAAPQWVKDLRKGIRDDNGAGWSVRLPPGKNSIQVQWEWGTREERERCNLPAEVEWSARNTLQIRNIVKSLHDLIEEKNYGLKQAIEMLFRQEDVGSSSKAKSLSIDGWKKAASDFLKRLEAANRPTTVKEIRRSVNRSIELFESPPAPRSGKAVLEQYSRLHFYNKEGNIVTPAGGQGRKRAYEEVCRFLKDAVANSGAPERYLPPADPDGEFKRSIVGRAPVSRARKRTIPLLPEQFSGFLDWLEANDMPELRLAVGLVGYYGLRECELAVMYPSATGGQLEVGSQCKENARQRMAYSGHRPPRKAHHLAVKGRPRDEALDLLAQYASGLVRLPKRIQDAIDSVEDPEVNNYRDVGIAFSAEVKKTQYWKNLVAKEPKLAVNGLRHGWAYRAHCTKGAWLDYNDAAAFMGHDEMTHIRYYASWTNETKKAKSAQEFNAAIASA